MQIQPSIWPSEALSGTPLWVEGQDVCSDFDQFFLHMKWWNDKMYAAGICVESGFMHGGADAAAGWWFWWWWWWCLVVFSVHFKKSSSHGDGPNWNRRIPGGPTSHRHSCSRSSHPNSQLLHRCWCIKIYSPSWGWTSPRVSWESPGKDYLAWWSHWSLSHCNSGCLAAA